MRRLALLGICLATAPVLGACGSHDPQTPAQSAADIDCSNGYLVAINVNTITRISDAPNGPTYTSSYAGQDQDGPAATITGGDATNGINAQLHLGETATSEGIGDFTLVSVKPGNDAESNLDGGNGGSATFCFVPADGFQISSNYTRGAGPKSA